VSVYGGFFEAEETLLLRISFLPSLVCVMYDFSGTARGHSTLRNDALVRRLEPSSVAILHHLHTSVNNRSVSSLLPGRSCRIVLLGHVWLVVNPGDEVAVSKQWGEETAVEILREID
jgi:hypothetical protein